MSDARQPASSLKAQLLPVMVVAFLVIVDQFTKQVIESLYHIGSNVEVIPGFFNLVHIKNRGAAFGLFGSLESVWVNRSFTIVALIAISAIAIMYRALPDEDKLSRISLVLICAGAIGNLIDRIRTGSVTDFLLFYINSYHWPAFNVADSCITIGVGLLAVALFVKPAEKG
ncbi:Lipoprotein signal peptidase [hydrothermal vent metagenome]|uniref:Lipoprotein signal peptidase n=1 Tax=hydrothermal vent metagenome TaxID=652676 RepID=A0A3B1D1H3_9ZZZZ